MGNIIDFSNLLGKFGKPFLPDDAAIVAWFDAADPDTIVEAGGFVSQWDDKSGEANHATDFVGVGQPVTGLSSINGLNALQFYNDPPTLLQVLDDPTLKFDAEDGFSAFAVYESPGYSGLGGAQEVIFAKFGISDTVVNYGMGYNDNVNPPFQSFLAVVAQNVGMVIPGGPTHNVPHLISMHRNDLGGSVDGELRLNASVVDTDSTTPPPASDAAIVLVIGSNNTNPNGGLEMKLGELILVKGVMDNFQIELMEGYLAWKWGLESNLPPSHPYKLLPP
jgi:hypothetical protein